MELKGNTTHCLFHRGFETHTKWGPAKPREIELAFKVNALFYRGLIIADSDLNNNANLQPFTADLNANVFCDALRCGFIRRAARTVGGEVISQIKLYEDLGKSNPSRVANIPRNHPLMLDKLLNDSESIYSPLAWKIDDLAGIFAERLVVELGLSSFGVDERRLADKVIEYIEGFRNDYKNLRGASIESELLPNHAEDPHEAIIWRAILDAYNGNVPAAFNGQVILGAPPGIKGDFIPGGPESSHDERKMATDYDERKMATDYYVNLIGNTADELFEIGIDQVSMNGSRWYIDIDRLMQLSLPEIIELREASSPDRFFDLRFQALGSSTRLSDSTIPLINERDLYMERLYENGKTLNVKITKEKLDSFKQIVIQRKNAEEEVKDLKSGYKTAISFIPGGAPCVALADAYSLGKNINRRSKSRRGLVENADVDVKNVELAFELGLKRPDYGVVRQVKNYILSGDNSHDPIKG